MKDSRGSIVDATIIATPRSATKRTNEWDLEMHQKQR